jgi:8-oxo-dGTP pyrophosphatase MutT (NUDIX family)
MGYIGELRAVVGHRALIVVSAAVIICDANERILLARRSDDDQWDLPGGSMEPGESLEDTARREVREELGVELGSLTLRDVRSGREVSHVYPNGDQVEGVVAVFVAYEMFGDLRLDPAEVSEVAYHPSRALPERMHSLARAVLATFTTRSA